MYGILNGLLWLVLPPYDRHAMLQVLARTAVFGCVAGWLIGPAMVDWLASGTPDDTLVVVGAVAAAWVVSVLAGLVVTIVNLAMVDFVRD